MSGANFFVIYTSANGRNVTLSPRLGSGYNARSFNSAAQVNLLAGSGVSNGIMVANIKCEYVTNPRRLEIDHQNQAPTAIPGVVMGT